MSASNPTLRDVLQAYAVLTGLSFAAPDRSYAETRVPCFQTLGNGYHGLNALGDVFAIEDYVWFQQGDGSVYVGAWPDTRWAARPVEIPDKWFKGVTADGGAILPALPALRPGVKLNGQYLVRLQLTQHEMVAQCSKHLKKPF